MIRRPTWKSEWVNFEVLFAIFWSLYRHKGTKCLYSSTSLVDWLMPVKLRTAAIRLSSLRWKRVFVGLRRAVDSHAWRPSRYGTKRFCGEDGAVSMPTRALRRDYNFTIRFRFRFEFLGSAKAGLRQMTPSYDFAMTLLRHWCNSFDSTSTNARKMILSVFVVCLRMVIKR